jgi:hypothetical protein
MTALVVVEAVAIGLLALLVAGLLRSHAEILRALHDAGINMEPEHEHRSDDAPAAVPLARPTKAPKVRPAADLVGTSPTDEQVYLSVTEVAHPTLVAFLSSSCATCAGFWEAFADGSTPTLPNEARLVVVTKGPDAESAARVRELAPRHFPTVMSTPTWDSYRVPVVPYFVYVDGPSGQVAGEGAASTWQQVDSLVRQAHAGGRSRERPARGSRPTPSDRQAEEERALIAAGIHPGHASLHPVAEDESHRDESHRDESHRDESHRDESHREGT